jgi:hypothetical protein
MCPNSGSLKNKSNIGDGNMAAGFFLVAPLFLVLPAGREISARGPR